MTHLILVAPLQAENLFRLNGVHLPTIVVSPQFENRGRQTATLTVPESVSHVEYDWYFDKDSLLEFSVRKVLHYAHLGMDIILARVELVNSDFSQFGREEMAKFETATTNLMKDLCQKRLPDNGQVRWVNRTLLAGHGEPIPVDWLQTDVPMESEFDGGDLRIQFGWGNGLIRGDLSNFRISIYEDASVMSQFLWCYLSDIETRSLQILQSSNEPKPSRRSTLTTDVIDLHYELAMMSVIHERLGTELNAEARGLIEEILTSWNFLTVVKGIDERINRLEHILGARSEILRRRSSSVVEVVVFTLTVTTIIALVLGIVQTAFGGAVEVEPGGWIMEATRGANLDYLVVGSVVACLVLLVGVNWWQKKVGSDSGLTSNRVVSGSEGGV